MFSRALALEAKRSNIRVNCLTPSIVSGTPLYDELMAHPFASKIFAKAEQMAASRVEPPRRRGRGSKLGPRGRRNPCLDAHRSATQASLGVVEADELAELAVFLASPAAAKLSGQCISMNGGISMA